MCHSREGPNNYREKQTNEKTQFHRIFSVGWSSDPRSVWNILGYCRDTYWVWTWILDVVSKISIFSLLALKQCGWATAWKSISLLFSAMLFTLTAIVFLKTSGFLRWAGGLQSLHHGPFHWNVNWSRQQQYGTQHSVTLPQTVPLGQSQDDLVMT